MNRCTFMPVVALVLVVVAAGCGSSGTKQPETPEPTQTHLFSPVGVNGVAAGIHIRRTADGECWTGSAADSRPDAWRCFLGDNILDPCFSNAGGTSTFVLCAEDPWSSVVRLALTKPLPQDMANEASDDPTAKHPWAIKLDDGKKCVAFTGATGAIAGIGVSYGCDGGGFLAGEPHRGKQTWTIFYGSSYDAKTLAERPIADAWW
jgi:hypothetical protein